MTVVIGDGPATSELPLGEFLTADGEVLRGCAFAIACWVIPRPPAITAGSWCSTP